MKTIWIFALCTLGVLTALAQQQLNFESYYLYLGNYPDEAENGFNVDVQGLAHDRDHWFVSQTETLWKIPVGNSLSSVSSNDPGVICRTFDDYPALSAYNHFGDMVYYEYRGRGYIVMPIENQDGTADPAIAVFRADTLAYVSHAPVDVNFQQECGWCAVDPRGYVYSSEGHPTNFIQYELDWEHLHANNQVILQTRQVIPMLDEGGGTLQLHHAQGGEFTPSGDLLYFVTGYYEDTDRFAEGIHVFETTTWQRIQHSTNGSSYFNYEFYPGWDTYQEPEGLTIWDLDDGRAPGISGQLHVLLLDNDDFFDSDDVYIKHYTHTIYVDRAYNGTEQGTPSQPFNTVIEANNLAWKGAQINVRANSYPGGLTFSKRVRVFGTGGIARIGQ